MALPPADVLVVFGLVAGAVTLFVSEVVSPDVTALCIVVALVVLEPWTGVDTEAAISGFASPATLTVLAMYVLSAGVQSTGTIRRLGARLAAVAGGSQSRLLAVVLGVTAPLAGVVNNTPVVAMFVPMVTDLADELKVSPSKFLIPLSYAAMLGGTLTLVGTATNIVASDLSRELVGRGIGMFELTPVALVVLAVGLAYLLTVGQWLLPERITPVDLVHEFGLEDYLSRVYVRRNSPLVGRTVEHAMAEVDADVDVIQIIRGEETVIAPVDRTIHEGDVLTVRGPPDDVAAFVALESLRRLPRAQVTEAELAEPLGLGTLVETVVPRESDLVGETVASARLRERYADTVLAVRRGGELFRESLATVRFSEGDGVLLYTTRETAEAMRDAGDLVVTEVAGVNAHPSAPERPFLATQGPLAVGIVVGVVLLAALDLLPVVVAALAGMVAMLLAGVLEPSEAYDAVAWEVVFLLAGVLPLGLALARSGGADYLGGLVAAASAGLPPLLVMALFYVLTGLFANVVTPVASVVLFLPVAVDAAAGLGADPFAFVLAVTFAGSTAFMTPMGYQTNLMVYSPGGYRFTDFVRVGGPLQLLLAAVTPVTIDLLVGVT